MLFAALPLESGICRVIGLDARLEGGFLHCAALLVEGAVEAQTVQGRLLSPTAETLLSATLPDLRDGIYDDVTLEVQICP